MKTFALSVAAVLSGAAALGGGGLATFVLVSHAVQLQCAEAGRRHDVVAAYDVDHGCTARGIFGVPVPIAIEAQESWRGSGDRPTLLRWASSSSL